MATPDSLVTQSVTAVACSLASRYSGPTRRNHAIWRAPGHVLDLDDEIRSSIASDRKSYFCQEPRHAGRDDLRQLLPAAAANEKTPDAGIDDRLSHGGAARSGEIVAAHLVV